MPDNADSALVDANIFLRYLTEDLPEQAEKARDLLERAERGEEELVTTDRPSGRKWWPFLGSRG